MLCIGMPQAQPAVRPLASLRHPCIITHTKRALIQLLDFIILPPVTVHTRSTTHSAHTCPCIFQAQCLSTLANHRLQCTEGFLDMYLIKQHIIITKIESQRRHHTNAPEYRNHSASFMTTALLASTGHHPMQTPCITCDGAPFCPRPPLRSAPCASDPRHGQ